jgi:hypothetical protein
MGETNKDGNGIHARRPHLGEERRLFFDDRKQSEAGYTKSFGYGVPVPKHSVEGSTVLPQGKL